MEQAAVTIKDALSAENSTKMKEERGTKPTLVLGKLHEPRFLVSFDYTQADASVVLHQADAPEAQALTPSSVLNAGPTIFVFFCK